MSLQIQMIGTGSAFSKKFYNNNALVFCNGFKLLIDCGYTAPRALQELNIPLTQIDGLLITHIHADHVGGMEEFAFRLKYSTNNHLMKLFVPSPILYPLWHYSLRGGLENKSEGLTRLEDYFEVIVLEEAVSTELFPGLKVDLFASQHIPEKPSYSLLLNDKLFYSSDSKLNEGLLAALLEQDRCHYILHDCQLSSPGIVHASLDDLLALPAAVQEKVMLMHYDDQMEQYIGKTGYMTFIQQHTLYDFP